MSANDKDSTSVDANSHQPPLYTHDFFDRDFRAQRKLLLPTLILPLVYTTLLMWACLSLYWGSLIPNNYLGKLTVYAIDLDGAFLGHQILSGINNSIITSSNHMNWKFGDPTNLGSRRILEDEHAWAVVEVSVNASSSLTRALAIGDPKYNPLSAISIYFLSARNQITTNSKVVPAILGVVNPLLSKANVIQTASFLSSNIGNETTLRIANHCPQCLASPFAAKQVDLLPFDSPTAMGPTMVGLIFLLTFTFSIFQILRITALTIGERLNLRSALLFRTTAALLSYLILSLSYTLINLAFGVPMSRRFGSAGFVIFWMLNFCTMAAVGLPMESLFTFLGLKWAGYFLSFWIIFNVSGAFTSFELTPGFYQYGYGFPFYNSIQGARTVLFGTKSHLGANFGVLIAWIAAGLLGMWVGTGWVMSRNRRAGAHTVD